MNGAPGLYRERWERDTQTNQQKAYDVILPFQSMLGVLNVLSPDSFTSSLDAMCRADLEGLRDWYASCIDWSTAAVVVGCALEFPEVLHDLWSNLFPLRWDRTIKAVSSIGLLLVVLGIAGELTFEHWRSGYEGLLQTFENVLLVDAEQHAASAQEAAGDAGESATKAAKAADRVSLASANAMRLASGARKEADAVAKDAQTISALIKSVTPRGHLIEASKESIARALSSFLGQKLAVVQCGLISGVPQPPILDRDTLEKTGTWAAIANNIRDMTDWSVSAYNLPDCGLERGVRVFANSAASSRTKKAAEVLSEELERVLPAQSNTILFLGSGNFALGQRADLPLALVAKDPELIVVAVGDWPIPWGLPEMGRYSGKRHQRQTLPGKGNKP